MATPNVLGAYELLRRAMQQQSLQQQGIDFGSTPNSATGYDPDDFGSQQGGLLGRLLALQAEQSPYQLSPGNDRAARSMPPDPNFRQLSRVTAVNPTQRVTQAAELPTMPWPNFSDIAQPSSGERMVEPYQSSRSVLGGQSGVAAIGPNSGKTLLAQAMANNGADSDKIVQAGYGLRGLPFPPLGPVTAPPFPVPALPDWWRAASDILKLYRKGFPRGSGGGGDEDECDERLGAEMNRCYARKDDYAHQDFLEACKARAKTRWDLCVRNGRKFPPREPPEWGPDDEEIWLNHNR
jgi:hypothetical protein